MGVGMTVEVMSRGVLHSIFIPSILKGGYNTCNNEDEGLTQYSSSLYMKGVMAQPWEVRCPVWPWTWTVARPIPSWLMEPGMMWEEVAWWSEGMSSSGVKEDNRRGWWGMTSQWRSLYPFPVRNIAGPECTDHLVSSGSSPTPSLWPTTPPSNQPMA